MSSEGKVALAQGRIVWVSGDLFEGKIQTIFGTQQPKLDKTGQQTTQYGFGLAIPKAELADPGRGAIWLAMHEQAFTMFPSRQIPPAFAMKYKDGDGVDDEGKPFNTREGYAGCLVFALTTNLPIRYFKFEGGQNIQVSSGIKCGDYVNVQVMVKPHPAIGQGKAGLYLNPMAVQLVAPGKEIINAPTGDQVFGMAPPPAPTNYVAPEQPVMPAFAPPPGAPAFAPPPMMAPPAAAPAAPAPHFAVLPPAFQPPPGGMPAAYPGAPAPVAAAPAFPAYGGGMPPIPR
jgi:hypothetical protein